MKWKLNALIGEAKDLGISISYRDIRDATGVSTSTISFIAQNQAKRADLETMDRLLRYFSEKLGRRLTTADLLEFEQPS